MTPVEQIESRDVPQDGSGGRKPHTVILGSGGPKKHYA